MNDTHAPIRDRLPADRASGPAPARVDAARLEAALRERVSGEVRFDDGSRALYATDASNYRQVPIGVVVPRTVDDVVATVAACREHGAPVLSRGGGTSLCGQTCNVAVVIDFSKYLNRIVEIDPERRTARVQPGVVLDELRDAARAHGLTFAPDPATHDHNTLGGMIGNNSCGPHSVMGGMTSDNVIALDVLTYDGTRTSVSALDDEALDAKCRRADRIGEIHRALRDLRDRYGDDIRRRFPEIPRRVSGYNLPALVSEHGLDVAQALVGSEGTCVVILEATLRLVPDPRCKVLLVLGYPDVYRAADAVPRVMSAGPIALEGIDDRLVNDMKSIGMHPRDVKLLPEGGGWLLVEFGGETREDATRRARHLMKQLEGDDEPPDMKLIDDPAHEQMIWTVRESGLGATAHVPNKPVTWEGWEDSSVPPERLGEYLRKLRELFERYGYHGDLYGHFGQGCVHTRIDFDLETAEGIRTWRRFLHEAAHLVTSLGGSISGEHGDGQSKAELLPIMFGERLSQAFLEFKSAWDPLNRMNPGKVVWAYRVDENLRLGTGYSTKPVKTWFAYPADQGNFSRAMLRCVGVGECRKKSGTMCPSYMATGEEMHSTRGRARLLFEMQRGETIRGGWHDEHVHEALDLCLSCMGCKHDCPVSVDMATYKAEFMAHYYDGHARPLQHWAFGLVDRWARWGSHAPALANALTQHAPFSSWAKRLTHVAPQRSLPRLADTPFVAWFRGRAPRTAGTRDVLLWPDTFNNYFMPHTAEAAVRVLEHAGCHVRIPREPLCCGRPLYEIGMLGRAREYLRRVLSVLDADIRAGVPVIVLEPACASVFREQLPHLLLGDEQAKRLAAQAVTLSEFLEHDRESLPLPSLRGSALVHGHCHHKSVLDFGAEESVLRRCGLDIDVLDSGCCGMAGSFGFDAGKYDVSMRCAERVLAPAVRSAADDTLVLADGFSCREQILQTTGRRALHLAEALDGAIGAGAAR